MAADEQLGRRGINPAAHARVVVARLSADVLDEHINIFAFKS